VKTFGWIDAYCELIKPTITIP